MISESLNCWRQPFTLTLFLDLEPGRQKSDVVASIHEFEKQLKASTHPVTQRIHFLRIFLLPGSGDRDSNQLVFSVVFDGEKIDFLNALVDGLREPLLGVLANTVGSGVLNSDPSPKEVAQWLFSNNGEPSTYHVGTVWNSLEEIRNDRKIVAEISAFLDDHGELAQRPATEIKTRIEEMLKQRIPDIISNTGKKTLKKLVRYVDGLLVLFLVLLIPLTPAFLIVNAMEWGGLALVLLTLGFAIALLAAVAGFIRCLEFFEDDIEVWPDDAYIRQIVSSENVRGQNQMTLVADVRNSLARRVIIVAVLWIADAVSRHCYRRGRLAGIDTIHFARFFLLEGNTRMLFMSDYDGSWSRYLFDFTGSGSLAVVPIWSSLKGCPKAKFLRWPAPGFEERFLPFTRGCQVEVACWYSSYPRLTVSEIKRNEKVRSGLFKPCSEREALDWLALLGGAKNE